MPGRNIVKEYKRNSYYHIYNRGVNKLPIFLSETDYNKFKLYLQEASQRYAIEIIKYTLVHNHFHLIIKQKEKRGIERMMRSVATRYALYFNFKYERIGTLFQGNYRARKINKEKDLEILINYMNKHTGDDWEISEIGLN